MKNWIIILVLLMCFTMSSCIVYQPQMVDVPLISKKNDLRIDAGVSIIPAAQATISYGLTEKIAVQGFGSVKSDKDYYLQLATGVFEKKGNNRVLECYGGFGYGHGEAYNDANPGNLYGDYQLYFGQLNYGMIASEKSNFEAGFGLKAGYLHTNLKDHNYYNISFDDNSIGSNSIVNYKDESFLLEPIGFIRFGGKRLKFNVKLGSSIIYKFTHTDKNLPYAFLNLGFGLNYRL